MRVYSFDFAVGTGYASCENFCLSRDDWAQIEPVHMHDFYELSYVYHGKGVHVINGVSYPVEKGALILLSKKDNHSFHSIEEFAMINCCFTTRNGLNYFPLGDSALLVTLTPELIEEVESILKIIEIELNQKENGYESIVKNYVDSLLLIITRRSENQISADPIWGDLLAYISENFDSVTLQDAMRIMKMSKSYFCRKFKEQFSVSFLTYVNRVRIHHAQRLLTSSNLTISEIAEQTGYGSNVCRLHEDFKKFTHTTPHKYKTERGSISAPSDLYA